MNREYKYLKVKKILKMAKRLTGCIEFPHFGARYPDATCIDGLLYDLDSLETIGDETGLTQGGEFPCPCCSTKSYIQEFIDNEYSIDRIYAHMKYIFERYGQYKCNPSLLTNK